MVADVGVFQVADWPMYGHVYTLPKKTVITFSQFWPVHSDRSIHMTLVVGSAPHLCPHFAAR